MSRRFSPILCLSPILWLACAGFGEAAPPEAKEKARTDGFLQSVENERAIVTSTVQADVRSQLENARTRMDTEPNQVKADLKLLKERVARTPELTTDVRAQLDRQIENALTETARRITEHDARQRETIRHQAAVRDQQAAMSEIERRQERGKQLMDRFKSLMDEAQLNGDLAKAIDAEMVAMEAQNASRRAAQGGQPGGGVPAQAVSYVEAWHNHERATAVREAKIRGVVDTMAGVERSHVPTPDTAPIIYPSAKEWQDLTVRRERYRAADVREQGRAEQRILHELEQTSSIEVIQVPLKDALEMLGEKHGIVIDVDNRALAELAIDSNTPITANYKGLTLRSILRLVLGQLDLTYVVDNEVLKITSKAKADTILTTKVYPVGDLVLPMNGGGFGSNPFQLGGGLGNQFGGNQQGGQNVGGQNFGAQGRNGGFFNVPDRLRRGF